MMLPSCHVTIPKWLPSSALWTSLPHRFSLRLPFQKFASSPRQLQRHPYGIGRFPSSASPSVQSSCEPAATKQ